MRKESFSKDILVWYKQHKRKLPWRKTKDPYKIWISEIILQQTRINQGLPYYNKFNRLFPTIFDFAKASEESILHAWQGLGYYSRARNMHKCAQYIVDNHQGVFPEDYDKLLKLPGIGPYTASAISSISFSKAYPVIDGNVFRVLSRIFGIKDEIQSSSGLKNFKKLAEELIPVEDPGDYNQAIMEFGALHCTPANPGCLNCIFSTECYAKKYNLQGTLPFKKPKNKSRKRHFIYFVFLNKEKIYLKKRVEKDIWHGLYEFILFEIANNDHTLIPESFRKSMLSGPQKSYFHKLTHQDIQADFYQVEINDERLLIELKTYPEGQFYLLTEIETLPKSVLINKYLKEAIF